jgi:hypothetical protein
MTELNNLELLKSAIMVNCMVSNGPTERLAARLLKLVDFLDDADASRKYEEMGILCDSILGDALMTERDAWPESTEAPSNFAADLAQASESTTMTRQEKLRLLSASLRARANRQPPGNHSTSASISE